MYSTKKKSISAFILLASLLSFSVFSFASAQVTDTVDSTTVTCNPLTRNMTTGAKDSSSDGQVSDLQFFLSDKGYLRADPTGYFGQATLAAVKAFQGDNGITQNGVVGPITRSKINALNCGGSSSLPTETGVTSNDNPAPPAGDGPALSFEFGGTAAGQSVSASNGAVISNVDPMSPRTWRWLATGASSVSARSVVSGENCGVGSYTTDVWQPWIGASVSGTRFNGSNTSTLGSSFYGCTIDASYSARNTQGGVSLARIKVNFASSPSSSGNAVVTYTCNGMPSAKQCPTGSIVENQNTTTSISSFVGNRTSSDVQVTWSSTASGNVCSLYRYTALGPTDTPYYETNARMVASRLPSIGTYSLPFSATAGNWPAPGKMQLKLVCGTAVERITVSGTITPTTGEKLKINSFSADKTSVNIGDKVLLSWSATGADSCTLSNTPLIAGRTTFSTLHDAVGQQQVTVDRNHVAAAAMAPYKLVCTNKSGGWASKMLGVSINGMVPTCNDSRLRYDYSTNVCKQINLPSISSFTSKGFSTKGSTNYVQLDWRYTYSNGCNLYYLSSTNETKLIGGYSPSQASALSDAESHTALEVPVLTSMISSGKIKFKLQCVGPDGPGTPKYLDVGAGSLTTSTTNNCPTGQIFDSAKGSCVTTPAKPVARVTISRTGTVTYPASIVYSLSSTGAKSCRVTDSTGFEYVAVSDNVTSRSVTSEETFGRITLAAQCFSDQNGGGVPSEIVNSTINIVCPSGKSWNATDKTCVNSTTSSGADTSTNSGTNTTSGTGNSTNTNTGTSNTNNQDQSPLGGASASCSVAVSPQRFYPDEALRVTVSSAGLSSMQYSLLGRSFENWGALNGTRTFAGGTFSVAGSYRFVFRGITSTGSVVNCAGGDVSLTLQSRPGTTTGQNQGTDAPNGMGIGVNAMGISQQAPAPVDSAVATPVGPATQGISPVAATPAEANAINAAIDAVASANVGPPAPDAPDADAGNDADDGSSSNGDSAGPDGGADW